MNEPIFFEGGGFLVTDRLLKTPRKTYALGQIEYVSVQRPLLLFAGLPAIGGAAFAFAFWRYLFAFEIGAILSISAAALLAAIVFGTLRVHSLAMRGDEVGLTFGFLHRLRQVRLAVEQAIASRVEATR